MAKKLLSNLDVNHNQLINMSVEVASSAPTSPSQGQVYFNSTSGHTFVYDGLAWVKLDANADIVQTGTGVGTRIFVQLSGESAPTGLAVGDVVIAVP